jgi:hypothetical protein
MITQGYLWHRACSSVCMPKDFNRNQDQRENAGPDPKNVHKPSDPEAPQRESEDERAHSKAGEGFEGDADEYTEAGFRSAGYRKSEADSGGAPAPKPADKPKR